MTPDAGATAGADAYDETFRAIHGNTLLHRLWAEAMQDQYPAEVEPFSSCCWWLLGQAVAGLRLRPGSTLVDLGCGRGGPGLWLARALSARLVGVDVSPAAVELSASRAPAFLPAGRATFRVGTFDATGMVDASADGAVSIDALPFAPDPEAALREVHRILAPGARFVFTAAEPIGTPPDAPDSWERRIAAAGLELESRTTNEHHHRHWRRLYGLAIEHAEILRDELGESVADALLAEAAGADQLDEVDPLVLVTRRPH